LTWINRLFLDHSDVNLIPFSSYILAWWETWKPIKILKPRHSFTYSFPHINPCKSLSTLVLVLLQRIATTTLLCHPFSATHCHHSSPKEISQHRFHPPSSPWHLHNLENSPAQLQNNHTQEVPLKSDLLFFKFWVCFYVWDIFGWWKLWIFSNFYWVWRAVKLWVKSPLK